LICGSRGFPDLEQVVAYVRTLPGNTTVVHGGAKGVDAAAGAEAVKRGLNVECVRPDYKALDPRNAPLVRNMAMVQSVMDGGRVVAFWDGASKGTEFTIKYAERLSVPVDVRRAHLAWPWGELRGLSLRQPWASLVALQCKRIETRSWSTPYRGWLAIHASATFTRQDQELALGEPFFSHLESGLFPSGDPSTWPSNQADVMFAIPTGKFIAVARLVGCYPTSRLDRQPDRRSAEYEFGDYSPDRWMWFLEDVHRLPEPVPAKGMLGVFALPVDVQRNIAEQCSVHVISREESSKR
jgi:hypothetical protein